MPITITRISVHDVRFPTSRDRDGSDAMNPDPDYSAAYVVLHTDAPGLEGHGLTFTIGRGNELCVAAVEALKLLIVGRTLESFTANMGAFWQHITGDFRRSKVCGKRLPSSNVAMRRVNLKSKGTTPDLRHTALSIS